MLSRCMVIPRLNFQLLYCDKSQIIFHCSMHNKCITWLMENSCDFNNNKTKKNVIYIVKKISDSLQTKINHMPKTSIEWNPPRAIWYDVSKTIHTRTHRTHRNQLSRSKHRTRLIWIQNRNPQRYRSFFADSHSLLFAQTICFFFSCC